MRSLLLFLHVLSMAAWLGAALWVAGDVRRTLALGRPATDALPARARPALGLDLGAGAATLLTGFVLMGVEALGRPSPVFTAAMVLGFVRLGIGAFGLRPAWRRVESALAPGGDPAAAIAGARRLGMLSGIAHTTWLLAVAGMIFGS